MGGTTSIRLERGDLRALDTRLSGAAIRIFNLERALRPEESPDEAVDLVCGHDVGVWSYGGKANQELTLELSFQDGSSRPRYTTRTETVRRDWWNDGDFRFGEAEAVQVIEGLENAISFGGRELRRHGGHFFYLTSLGLFHSADDGRRWQSSAPETVDVVEGSRPDAFRRGRAMAPLATNDAAVLKDDGGILHLVVATDDGLYRLTIDGHRYEWTKVPVLSGISCIRLLRLRTPNREVFTASFLCLTEHAIFLVSGTATDDPVLSGDTDGLIRTWNLSEAMIRSSTGGIYDARAALGRLANATEHPDGKAMVLFGETGFAVVDISENASEALEFRLRGASDPALLRDRVKIVGSLYYSSGEKAVFLSGGGLLVCNGDQLLWLEDDLRLRAILDFQIGKEPYEEQSISCVAEPRPGFLALGSTGGGLLYMSLTSVLRPEEARLPQVAVLSRKTPLVLEEIIVPGIARECGPGEYVLDHNPPCGNDTAKQETEAIITAVLAIAAAASGAEVIAVELMQKAIFQLIVAYGRNDSPLLRLLASEFYGYRGKSRCYIISSAPLLPSDTLIDLIPRAMEGSGINAPSQQLTTERIDADASLGWCAFSGQPGRDVVAEGRVIAHTEFALFKNWSHNRTRTVRLDARVRRDLGKGRRFQT